MLRLSGIIVALFFLVGCNSLLFFPQQEYALSPTELGLEYQEIRIPAADGTQLESWLLLHKTPGAAKGTILFLHGNAENISTHIFSVLWLPSEGYDVLLLDYRGFGASEGSVSMNDSIGDIRSTVKFLYDRSCGKIIVFGQSIGAALAIAAIASATVQEHVSALIADSAPSSYRLIAREKLSELWLTWPFQWPLSLLLSDYYSPDRYISEIQVPVLLSHSKDDEIVPYHHGERLFQLVEGKKNFSFASYEGAKHIQIFRSRAGRERFLMFLASLR